MHNQMCRIVLWTSDNHFQTIVHLDLLQVVFYVQGAWHSPYTKNPILRVSLHILITSLVSSNSSCSDNIYQCNDNLDSCPNDPGNDPDKGIADFAGFRVYRSSTSPQVSMSDFLLSSCTLHTCVLVFLYLLT